MVLRGTDTPTTVTGRLDSASARLDDLARAQARGAQEVSNDAGHKLLLNPQNPNPLLVASGGNEAIDSGLGFSQGTLQVVSEDGQEWRDIEASGLVLHDAVSVPSVNVGDGGISTTGGVDATRVTSTGIVRGSTGTFDGNVNAAGASLGSNGIFTPGPVNTGPLGASQITSSGAVNGGTGNLSGELNANGANLGNYGMWSWGPLAIQNTVGSGALNVSNHIQTNSMTATGDVSVLGTALSAIINWWNNLFSSSELKEGFAEVDEADADALLAAPVQRWTFIPRWVEQPLGPEAEGPLNLVDRRPNDRPHYGPIAEDLPEILRYTEAGEEHFRVDLVSFQGLLLHICQRQERQIKDLTARVAVLETGKETARGA